MTLWFAPGAVLVLGAPDRRADLDPVELVIRGPIRGGPRQIFSTIGAGGTLTGMVRLAGDRNPAVLPEWWGGGRGDGTEDLAALSAAITTAFSRTLGGVTEAPLPVELGVGYRLSRPLVISAKYPEDRGCGFVLRAQPTVAGSSRLATFIAERGFRGDAMLVIRDRAAILIENVSMDGGLNAARCVLHHVRPRRRLPSADLYRNCEFFGATSALVETRSLPTEPDMVASPALLGTVIFECCAFFRREGISVEAACGVDCGAAEAALTRFEHCVFDGAAVSMIRARGGAISASGCSFLNTAVDGPRGTSDGGVDVLLDVSDSTKKAGDSASCSLTACDSGSAHLLCAVRGRVVRQSVLVGVTHTPQTTERSEPWSIYWEMMGAEDSDGSTLFLNGCTLSHPVFWRMASGKILDIGNRLRRDGSSGMVLSAAFRIFPRPPGM